MCGGKWRGRTRDWDEFMNHDDDTGEATTPVSGRIHFGLSIDQNIEAMSQDASEFGVRWRGPFVEKKYGEELAALELSAFNIKKSLGPSNGYLLGGFYVSGRSAGNYLAGRNAALVKPPIIYTMTWGRWWTTVMKRAGALHCHCNDAPPPWYGEIPFTGYWVKRGFESVQKQ